LLPDYHESIVQPGHTVAIHHQEIAPGNTVHRQSIVLDLQQTALAPTTLPLDNGSQLTSRHHLSSGTGAVAALPYLRLLCG
jgi:hypothetical protein